MKEISFKLKPGKRNYNTMIEGSKKIEEKEKDNSKKEEKKEKKKEGKEESKNGSSVKERGHFIKKIKKFRHSNDIIISTEMNNIKNNLNPNPQSRLSSMKKMSKINNKKYMYSTISSYQFYCICKKNKNQDNLKCQICQDSFIIDINNFMRGFYYYVLFLENKPNNKIGIDTSDSTFKLLEKNNIIEKDPNFNQYKELEQFFNYQFILITYDKYYKFAQKNNNNELVENSIEEIYDKIIPKYIQIFIKAKRSFLTEVSEGDSAL
jgi:transcription elongation factor Elf1